MSGVLETWYDVFTRDKIILYILLALLVVLGGKWNRSRNYAVVWAILCVVCVGMIALTGVSICHWMKYPVNFEESFQFPVFIIAAVVYLDLFIWLLCGAFAKRKNE